MRTFVAAAALLCMAGCGGGVDDGFKGSRGTVSGKVTYKGAAIPAGSIVAFQSRSGGYSAAGKTNASGEYALSYAGKSQLPATEYVVQISPPQGAAETKAADPSAAAVGVVDQNAPAATAAPSLPFPAKYTNLGAFEYTVKAGANTANFELKDE